MPSPASPGMLDVTQLVNLTHTVYMIGGPPNELSDGSWPLFSIYSKIVEGDDKKTAERREKNADGIVIFVSTTESSSSSTHS
jgi:hypothetical protein